MQIISYKKKNKKNKKIVILKLKNTTNQIVSSFTLYNKYQSFAVDNKMIDCNEEIKIKLEVDEFDEFKIDNIGYPQLNKKNTVDMTKGSPAKLIISFALPVFLSSLFQQLYNSVDALIVGNFIGKEALAAVSSSGSLIHMFTSFFMGTAMGAGVLIARYFGAKDYH